jgi:hypothetical protein
MNTDETLIKTDNAKRAGNSSRGFSYLASPKLALIETSKYTI